MEDFNTTGRSPVFKKIDRAVFEQIDKFKTTPNYTPVQDFYNGMDEEQQKVFKAALNIAMVIIPLLLLAFLWWQNGKLKDDLDIRTAILQKSLEIIGQKESLQEVSPRILATNPIDSDGMMTSRLSNILSASGMDTSRIRVSNFTSEQISTGVNRAEADIQFTNFSTDELMNMFTALIQREKFRIQSVDITRSGETNLLTGQFRAIHFAAIETGTEEE